MIPPIKTSNSINLFHNLSRRELGNKPHLRKDRLVRDKINGNNVEKREQRFSSIVTALAVDETLGLIAVGTFSQMALYNIESMAKPIWESSERYIQSIKIIVSESAKVSILWIDRLKKMDFRDVSLKKVEVIKGRVSSHVRAVRIESYKDFQISACSIRERIFFANNSCYELIDHEDNEDSMYFQKVPGTQTEMAFEEIRAVNKKLVYITNTFVSIYDLKNDAQIYSLGMEELQLCQQPPLDVYLWRSSNKINLYIFATDNTEDKLFCKLGGHLEIAEGFGEPEIAVVDLETHKIEYKYPNEKITKETGGSCCLLKRQNWYIQKGLRCFTAKNWVENREVRLGFPPIQVYLQGHLLLSSLSDRTDIYHVDSMTKLAQVKYSNMHVVSALTTRRVFIAINEKLTMWNFLDKKGSAEAEEKEAADSLTLVPTRLQS